MEYYEQVGNANLADEFYAELQRLIREAAKRPESFPIRERDIRRANLRRFPYHFLFRMTSEAVRILVVRHHRREPSLGTGRR
jgi:plasmid stabilization system protein ParE